MVMTDPIADFLTRIRNANQAKHEVLEVPASNIKKGIAEILNREGFVKKVCLLIKKHAKRTLVEKLSLTFGKIKIQSS